MSNESTDAALVAGHLAGDPSALAGIYDRYADALHDTAASMLRDRHDAADVTHDVIVIASQKLDQLRDAERLKPWLFAILRNEVYRRTRHRKRTVVTDFNSEFDVVDEGGLDADADTAAGSELADMVRDAAGGLDERDQLVLELSVRQGLEGQDLADALGVSANQSYTLVHRMRERIQRSLGAFAIASTGRNDCDDLASMLKAWDGEFTVLIRKRVARHIDHCDVCDDRRRKIAPLALFGAAPVLAAPAALRERTLVAARQGGGSLADVGVATYRFTSSGGFPGPIRAAGRVAAWVTPTIAAGLVALLAGVAFLMIGGDDESLRSADVEVPDVSSTITTAPSTTSFAASSGTTVATTSSPGTTLSSATTPSTPTRIASTTNVPVAAQPATTVPPTTAAPAPAPPVPAPPAPAPPAPAPPMPAPPAPPAPAPPAPAPPAPAPPAPVPPVPPGQLTGSTGLVDLGGSAPTAQFTLSNPGGLAVQWSLSGSPAPFSVSPSTGTLGPSLSADITIGFDRRGRAEGSAQRAVVSFVGTGGQRVDLAITGGVERPPVFRNPQLSNPFCSTLMEFDVTASIIDDSPPLNVSATVVGPAGQTGSAAMFPSDRAGGHAGRVQVVNNSGVIADLNGDWSFTITATDTRGNTSIASGTLDVTC